MNNNPYPPQNGQNPYEQGTPQNGAPFAPPYGNPGYGYPYYGAPQNPAPQQNPYAGQTPPPVAPPPQPLVEDKDADVAEPEELERQERMRRRLYWLIIGLCIIVTAFVIWEVVDLFSGI